MHEEDPKKITQDDVDSIYLAKRIAMLTFEFWQNSDSERYAAGVLEIISASPIKQVSQAFMFLSQFMVIQVAQEPTEEGKIALSRYLDEIGLFMDPALQDLGEE